LYEVYVDLRFGISMPINKSLITKPSVGVY